MPTVNILIADDHDLMRRGLKTLIEAKPGWSVVDEAHTGREAVAKAEQLKPDIVIAVIFPCPSSTDWKRREGGYGKRRPLAKF